MLEQSRRWGTDLNDVPSSLYIFRESWRMQYNDSQQEAHSHL